MEKKGEKGVLAENGGRQIFFPTQPKSESWKMKTEQPAKMGNNR